MKKIGGIAIAMLISIAVKSQVEPAYFIYSTSGKVTIRHINTRLPAIPKQVLYNRDIIEIREPQGQITLVGKDGILFTLQGKGEFRADHLNVKDIAHSDRITKEFLRLIWSSLAYPSKDADHLKYESLSNFWGGPQNSKGCNFAKFPYDNSVFASDSILFSWKNQDPSKTYRFSIFDKNRNPAIELLVRDTQMELISHSLPYGAYYWSVNTTTHPCKNLVMSQFAIVSKPEEGLVTRSLINSVPAEEDSMLYNLHVSDALGQRGYVEEALRYFNRSWYLYFKGKQ
jgi:hypothetical protein